VAHQTAQLDSTTAAAVKQLGEKKTQAIARESYDEAERLKRVIYGLVYLGKQSAVMEAQKKEARGWRKLCSCWAGQVRY
jgi:hypothetical protein